MGRGASFAVVCAVWVLSLMAAGGAYGSSFTITASYAVSGGGSPTAPTLNYYAGGVLEHVALTSTPAAYSADAGSAWSVTPNPLGGSSSHEVWQTSATTSGTVVDALTFDAVYYNAYQGNFSETFSGGSRPPTTGITLTYTFLGEQQALVLSGSFQSVLVDAGTTWSVPDPAYSNFIAYSPSPSSGAMDAKLQQSIAFTSGGITSNSRCAGPTPLAVFESSPFGCFVPALLATLSTPIGEQATMGFILLGVNVAVFNKTQSIWLALVVLWVAGGAFGWMMPSYAAMIGQIFFYVALAGLVMKVIFRFW